MSFTRLFNVFIVGTITLMVIAFLVVNIPLFFSAPLNNSNNEAIETGTGSAIEDIEEWDTYVNYDYKYIFRYPNKVSIENIKLQEYIANPEQYNGVHSDDICVKIKHGVAWAHIYVSPRDPNINKFCGKYEYDSSVDSERKQIQIGDKTYYGQSINTINEELDPNFNIEELNIAIIPNGEIDLRIEYGTTAVLETREGKTNEDYLKDKEVIEEILKTIELI